MMKEVMEIPFVRDTNLQASMVALPYNSTQFALYIILPDQPGLENLVNLERSLKEGDVDSMIRRMSASTVQVSIPRVKLTWKNDLKEIVARLGVCDVFSATRADFRRLAVDNDGLFLSALNHQADIEINERGTSAAAATVGAVSKTARSFVANRPFLFFIRDNVSGLPLFWGRVVRPEGAPAPSNP
jgi:serpin B